MDTDSISLDLIPIDERQEEPVTLLVNGTETIPIEATLQPNRSFGIVDLWKIRSLKRQFTFYR